MNSYEIDKLAKGVAKYLAIEIMNNQELLDAISPPRLMDISEVSALTKIPKGTLYQKVNEIPHTKIGRRLLFTDRGVISWLQRKAR